MKKVEKKLGIVTLNGYFNFGNRLQNYALTRVLEKKGFDVYTLWNINKKEKMKNFIKSKLFFANKYDRFRKFYKFSKTNMKELDMNDKNINMLDYFVVGSDQVWNYKLMDKDKTWFYAPKNKKTISYSASLGPSEIPESFGEKLSSMLKEYSSISVREEKGKELLSNIIPKKEINVNIDPTLLLNDTEWKNIAKKPNKNVPSKFIFVYFLGDIHDENYNIIKKYAAEKNAKIINILDENSEFYSAGPEEFIYFIENSLLVCTDSFHACVFSFIFNKPFLIFKRTGVGISNDLYSRIENLIVKFKLDNREFKGNYINDEVLNVNYEKGHKVLIDESKKANDYLNKSLK